MSKARFSTFGGFAVICVVLIPAFAISRVGEGDTGSGAVEVAAEDVPAQELIANNCGQCHTLAAAGIDGVVGPDLDERLVPTGTNTAGDYTRIYGQTIQAITCGFGGGRMPKAIVRGENARTAAAFVAVYAGQIGRGPTTDMSAADKPPPPPCP